METQKGMYGLPQAGKVANDKLNLHLSKFGYNPAPITLGLWRHQISPLQLLLVVDDFGIKYERQEDITHLLGALMTIYKISEDWDGKLYCGLKLESDYYKREVMVSMPKYVTKALHKFQHSTPKRAQYAPHQWTHPNYGATKQLATPLDTSPPIPEERKRRIQQIVETFLYYARAVDCTMLPALNTLAEKQSSPTKNTESESTHFRDYTATNPSVIIQYKASNVILHIDSDASYLSEPRARSRTGGHY